MIIVTKPNVNEEQITTIKARVESFGLQTTVSRDRERTVVGVIGDAKRVSEDALSDLPSVERITHIS